MSEDILETGDDQNDSIAEESLAANTLKPNSQSISDPKSKVEFMQSMLGNMHAMKKEDLTKWYHQAIALIGKEADKLPSDANADSNSSTIDGKQGKGPKTRDAMPKIMSITPGQSMKEDVEEMLSGEDLSEEFKEKATTLFEAAVNLKITSEIARIEEEFAAQIDEKVNEQIQEIETRLDAYLDYVVRTWMEENQVAVESTLRSEIAEEFMNGLKTLFVEHYIDVPAEKVDVVESMTQKIEDLEKALNDMIEENAELKNETVENRRKEIVVEMTDGLTLSQVEKFVALAEGISFNGDLDVYRGKLSTVRSTYFNNGNVANKSTNIEEETFVESNSSESSTKYIDPEVNRYVQAISRTVKH